MNNSPKNDMCWKCTHPQAVKYVDTFVSSSEHICRNVALHHLLSSWSSAVNGLHQYESKHLAKSVPICWMAWLWVHFQYIFTFGLPNPLKEQFTKIAPFTYLISSVKNQRRCFKIFNTMMLIFAITEMHIKAVNETPAYFMQ